MQCQATVLPGNLRVDEAVRRALGRPPRDMYDPVVVELPNGAYRILDVTVLVLAQSRTIANLSNVVGKLGQAGCPDLPGRRGRKTSSSRCCACWDR